jgi:hypothetical protein
VPVVTPDPKADFPARRHPPWRILPTPGAKAVQIQRSTAIPQRSHPGKALSPAHSLIRSAFVRLASRRVWSLSESNFPFGSSRPDTGERLYLVSEQIAAMSQDALKKLRAGIRHGGFCRRLGPKLCKSNGRQRSHKGAIPETRFLLLSASMSSFEVTIRP